MMKNYIASKFLKWQTKRTFNALYWWAVTAPLTDAEDAQVINTLDILRKSLYKSST